MSGDGEPLRRGKPRTASAGPGKAIAAARLAPAFPPQDIARNVAALNSPRRSAASGPRAPADPPPPQPGTAP